MWFERINELELELTTHTERINGGKYLSKHCRQWKFTLR